MQVTADDYMTTDIIDQAYQRQADLAAKFLDDLSRVVALTQPDTSESIYTVPYPALINIIERNLDELTKNGYAPSGMERTVEWHGELNDLRRFSYLDVNRWFNSIDLVNKLIDYIVNRGLITGIYSSGNDWTRQTLRTVDKYA